ncbi:MAG: Spy/CpxP family protein refolding chaperone [bacterium]
MSKKKYLYAALAGAIVIAGALAACNVRHDYHHDGDRIGHAHHGLMLGERMIKRLSRKLELDDAQRDALRTVAEDARPSLMRMRDQLRESRRAMLDLDPNAADYDDRVAELASQHGALASEMTRKAAEIKATLAEVLTAKQMERLTKMLSRDRHRS